MQTRLAFAQSHSFIRNRLFIETKNPMTHNFT